MFRFVFKADPPKRPKKGLAADCGYEITDVVSLQLQFTFIEGQMDWTTLEVGGVRAGASLNSLNFGSSPNSQTPKTETRTFTFQSHESETDAMRALFTFDAKSQFELFVDVKGGIPQFTVTDAKAVVKGNHYYEVPEAGPLASMLAAVVSLVLRRARQRLVREPPETVA